MIARGSQGGIALGSGACDALAVDVGTPSAGSPGRSWPAGYDGLACPVTPRLGTFPAGGPSGPGLRVHAFMAGSGRTRYRGPAEVHVLLR